MSEHNMTNLVIVSTIFALTCLVTPTNANAATVGYNGQVTATLIQDGVYGNCMVNLDKVVNEQGLEGCAGNWVTFSCSGDFNPKDVGYRKFDAAQLAFYTGKEIRVYVNDQKKHNGVCYAERVDARIQ